MTHYNSLNVKLSNSQLNKLKSAIKNETEVDILQIFIKKPLSTDIKSSKTQISMMIQSGEFPGRVLGPLLKIRYH